MSLLPVFTTSFSGAVNRHVTPSTSKLNVDEAFRPAAVRRSSTTVPNPEIRFSLHGRSAAFAPRHLEVGLSSALVDPPDERDVALIVRQRAVA